LRFAPTRALAWAAAPLLLAALSACQTTAGRTDAGPAAPTLRVDGGGVVIEGETRGGLSATELATRLDRLLREGRRASAELLAGRYPAHAATLIHDDKVVRSDVGPLLATWIDRRGLGGATAYVEARRGSPAVYRDFDRARDRVLALWRSGDFDDAARVEFPGIEGPTAEPAWEAVWLTTWSHLLAGQPDAALATLDGVTLPAPASRYRAAMFDLLRARLEAGEEPELASRRWAAVAETFMLVEDADPTLGQRVLAWRPSEAAWPPGVTARGVEAHVGRLMLERNAHGDALLHLRRAESLPGDEPTQASLRLDQAKAAAGMGQAELASSMLVGLIETDLATEALAALGALELARGRLTLALRLLERAETRSAPSPSASLAADLAMARLASGRGEQTLASLHAAQDRFRDTGQIAALIQSLENEARLLEGLDNPAGAERARRRLLSIEAAGLGG